MKIKLFSLLFILYTAQLFAAETVTIDGITYTLGNGESSYWTTTSFPINWGGADNWAVITNFSENLTEASIPKSITYNGMEYFVRSITVTNRTLKKLEIQDGVQLYWNGFSSGSTISLLSLETIELGKDVRIFTTSRGRLAGTDKVKSIYCKDETPCMPSPHSSTADGLHVYFGDFLGTTIYVPKGAEKTYGSTFGWSLYVNIIGLEELGNVTESHVTSANFNFNQKSAIIDTHTVTALPIAIDNKNEVSAIEFDMVLPANVEVQGENPITGSERGAEMSFSTTTNEDGSLHVVATATTALAAGKGNIATIAVQTAKSDNYAITLRNVKVTTKTGKVISLDNEVLQFVANHKKGDYNEDGDVDIVDAQNLLDYVLGI